MRILHVIMNIALEHLYMLQTQIPCFYIGYQILFLILAFPQVEMTGDYTPDLVALLSADIIISTPEKWDGISRNWHTRSYVKKVHLFSIDCCIGLPFS